jgi:RNA polymerase sigma factor (sigma-70 family)
MARDTASWGICWDAAAAESVDVSQRWVLTAMRQHGHALLTMLWRFLGNEQDACDAYQDTFLHLVQYKGSGKLSNVRAFLFRTAANVAISTLRRKRLHENACQVIAQRPPAERIDPSGELDARQLQEALRIHIARLPEKLQNVVLLKDLAELPYAQVAKIIGTSVVAARVYRCRAIRLLSIWMGPGQSQHDASELSDAEDSQL